MEDLQSPFDSKGIIPNDVLDIYPIPQVRIDVTLQRGSALALRQTLPVACSSQLQQLSLGTRNLLWRRQYGLLRTGSSGGNSVSKDHSGGTRRQVG